MNVHRSYVSSLEAVLPDVQMPVYTARVMVGEPPQEHPKLVIAINRKFALDFGNDSAVVRMLAAQLATAADDMDSMRKKQ